MAQKVRSLFSDELHRKNQSNAYVLARGPKEADQQGLGQFGEATVRQRAG